MKKRFLSLALAMTMLLAGAAAHAASPSITTNDFGYGAEVDGNIMHIEFRGDLPEMMTELAKEVLLNIKDYLLSDTVINWFDDDIKAKVAELLPVDFDLNDLVIYEFVSLVVDIFDDLADDVEAIFTFPTEFKEGMDIVVLIGVLDTEPTMEDADLDAVISGIKWIALRAEAMAAEEVMTEEADSAMVSKIKVYFTNESLKDLSAAQEIMMAVMSEPIEQFL